MEDNVALESTKQKQFVKSIKGIKQLLKKKGNASKDTKEKPIKHGKVYKKKQKGLVYLSHIPHGFYENEMTQYFKQFGVVTNARVIRSKHTGNSKGHAFVEFREPAVAQIVADTMNNYLMGKRLIKAAYIPPEKQKRLAMRKHWSPMHNPGNDRRLQMKKAYNVNKDEKGELKRARHILQNLSKTKKKLSELGINYDFFKPVDVPETLLLTNDKVKEEQGESKDNVAVKTESKKSKKKNKAIDVKETSSKDGKVKEVGAFVKAAEKQSSKKAVKGKGDASNIVEVQETKTNKRQQKNQQQKLKDAGVKPLEDYIKVQEDSESDDSPYEFDSDEFEKSLENDDEDSSDNESIDETNEAESDVVSEEELPLPLVKGKGKQKSHIMQLKNKKMKKEVEKTPEQMKRKPMEKSTPTATSKKPKFEKSKQKPSKKKQFKKK